MKPPFTYARTDDDDAGGDLFTSFSRFLRSPTITPEATVRIIFLIKVLFLPHIAKTTLLTTGSKSEILLI
jgi:hypothetical protein